MSFLSRVDTRYKIVAKLPTTEICDDLKGFVELERKEFLLDEHHLSLEKRKELAQLRKKELEKKKNEIIKDIKGDEALTAKQKDSDIKRLETHLDHYGRGLDSMVNAAKWRDAEDIPDAEWEKKILGSKGEKLEKDKIPAFAMPPGLTCPKASTCKNHCFAMSGHTEFVDMVRDSHSAAMGLSERDDFVDKVNGIFQKKRPISRYPKADPKKPYRIHAWGDFYSNGYAQKWIQIINDNPNVWFYAYTKSFAMPAIKGLMSDIKKGEVKNAKVIQSLNGKSDKQIDSKEPIAVVFKSRQDMDDWNAGITSNDKSKYDKQKEQRLAELSEEISGLVATILKSRNTVIKYLKDKGVSLDLKKEKLSELKEEIKKKGSAFLKSGSDKQVKGELRSLRKALSDAEYDLTVVVKEKRKLKRDLSHEREESYRNLTNLLTKLKITPKGGQFIECNESDLVAADPKKKRIGIVEHGELHQPRGYKIQEIEQSITAQFSFETLRGTGTLGCEHMHGDHEMVEKEA